MTNIRAHGFESKAQLEEYLNDIESTGPDLGPGSSQVPIEEEIERLWKQVAELRNGISSVLRATENRARRSTSLWLKIGTVMAILFLGRLAQNL
ncbi:hypothetical protein BN77_p11000 [Rhizobium mesoamericanum STM3625]|uniref:Transmembrane protein n=1 Tax=Rhizobium mesoamericanum STM3625 TaxID=1211777 RepID=K0PX05_9HYPH|nr:hypothetical protein BN77_p11000 [Rhizobium mesoamericanum STM3625]